MKNLENLILGADFRQGAKDAVQEAVNAANAKGLPKAYEPDFSQAKAQAVDAPKAGTAQEKKPMRAA